MHEAQCSRPECADCGGVTFVAGQNQTARHAILAEDGLGCHGAVNVRQDQVHQDHIWCEGKRQFDCLRAVAGFADHINAVPRIGKQHAQGLADDGMIFDDEHAERGVCGCRVRVIDQNQSSSTGTKR